jgi:hypothetical protein
MQRNSRNSTTMLPMTWAQPEELPKAIKPARAIMASTTGANQKKWYRWR